MNLSLILSNSPITFLLNSCSVAVNIFMNYMPSLPSQHLLQEPFQHHLCHNVLLDIYSNIFITSKSRFLGSMSLLQSSQIMAVLGESCFASGDFRCTHLFCLNILSSAFCDYCQHCNLNCCYCFLYNCLLYCPSDSHSLFSALNLCQSFFCCVPSFTSDIM